MKGSIFAATSIECPPPACASGHGIGTSVLGYLSSPDKSEEHESKIELYTTFALLVLNCQASFWLFEQWTWGEATTANRMERQRGLMIQPCNGIRSYFPASHLNHAPLSPLAEFFVSFGVARMSRNLSNCRMRWCLSALLPESLTVHSWQAIFPPYHITSLHKSKLCSSRQKQE